MCRNPGFSVFLVLLNPPVILESRKEGREMEGRQERRKGRMEGRKRGREERKEGRE